MISLDAGWKGLLIRFFNGIYAGWKDGFLQMPILSHLKAGIRQVPFLIHYWLPTVIILFLIKLWKPGHYLLVEDKRVEHFFLSISVFFLCFWKLTFLFLFLTYGLGNLFMFLQLGVLSCSLTQLICTSSFLCPSDDMHTFKMEEKNHIYVNLTWWSDKMCRMLLITHGRVYIIMMPTYQSRWIQVCMNNI